MPSTDALLARARLQADQPATADTVAYEDCAYLDLDPDTDSLPGEPADTAAVELLDHLCDVVVTTVAPDALQFLTGQLPEPTSAWLLGCALRLAGVDDGARFWWQYAAGAEFTPAAYCLSLYHRARGEAHAAAFWQDQTGLDTTDASDTLIVSGICPPEHQLSFDASISTVLRILSRLDAPGQRSRTRRADAITNYTANAVTRGYRRYPGVEIPVPEPRFADRIRFILSATPPWTRHVPRTFNTNLPSRRRSSHTNGTPAHDTAVEATSG
ncbi:hypothetical protein [Streptomyces sp. AC555_RSS877]|uniref:hypothetical protein n=1 Tax=Streptomyces sp. AC555_RSS877 TaxID=2823688 RepID=UPI001C261B4D|nr:hypothetical protein [Streptomyces sp. AC555_RSS877]